MKISNFAKSPPQDGELDMEMVRFVIHHFLQKQDKINSKMTSYGIMHVIENFCAALYRRNECRSHNSHVVAAMKKERYKGERSRDNSANYLFNISTQSLLDLRVIEGRLIKDYDTTIKELDALFPD